MNKAFFFFIINIQAESDYNWQLRPTEASSLFVDKLSVFQTKSKVNIL